MVLNIRPAAVAAFMYALLIPGAMFFIRSKINGRGKNGTGLIVKGLSTAVILAAAIMGMLYLQQQLASGTYDSGGAGASGEYTAFYGQVLFYAALIVLGLAFGLAGDIAICSDFIAGVAFFAIGHMCYITAFFAVSLTPLWALPVFAAVYIVAFAVYRASGMKPGKMMIPAAVYSAILIAMLSAAASVFSGAPGSLFGAVVFAGALLFAVSDALLAMCSFAMKNWRLKKAVRNRLSATYTCCYCLGQSFIALSIVLALPF